MTALNPNNTPRFKVFYTGGSHQHTQEWRSHLSPAAISVDLDVFWTAMNALLYSTTIDDVQFAAAGSNVFNSVAMPFVGQTYGSGTPSAATAPYFISYIARSSDGHRLRTYFYNVNVLGVDYRFVAGENTDVDSTIAALVAAGGDVRTISDATPVWKSYANGGVSAYWQRQVRP